MRQLRYFLAVADHGSLSRAALEVFIAQSALSKQIAELEGELGVQLLFRGRHGVSMTEAGQTFYSYAQAILKQLTDVKAAVLTSPLSIVGSVVLGLPQSVSAALALPLFRAAREKLPGVSLHLNEELTGNMLDQLRHGRVDLAVFAPVAPASDVVYVPFVQEEFYLLRSEEAEGDFPSSGDMDLARVAQIALIMPAPQHSHCTRGPISEAFRLAGLPLKIAAEINSVHILKSAVEAGTAPTVMPYALAEHEIAVGRMLAHRIRPEAVTRTLGVCYSSHLPLTNAKKAVTDLVFTVSRELCNARSWVGAEYVGP